jgi:hypothetical protein
LRRRYDDITEVTQRAHAGADATFLAWRLAAEPQAPSLSRSELAQGAKPALTATTGVPQRELHQPAVSPVGRGGEPSAVGYDFWVASRCSAGLGRLGHPGSQGSSFTREAAVQMIA